MSAKMFMMHAQLVNLVNVFLSKFPNSFPFIHINERKNVHNNKTIKLSETLAKFIPNIFREICSHKISKETHEINVIIT